MPRSVMSAVPGDSQNPDVPPFLRSPQEQPVHVLIDRNVSFLQFMTALVSAGLVARNDGHGNILITRQPDEPKEG